MHFAYSIVHNYTVRAGYIAALALIIIKMLQVPVW